MRARVAVGRGRVAVALALLVAWASCGPLKRLAYEGVDRDSWQQPERVVEALAITPGAYVADLGAGGGYFSFRLAEAVGPAGRLFAVDIDPDMTAYIAREAEARGLSQIHVVEAGPDDPRLPAEGVDLVLTVNAYHHLEARPAYFARMREHLRPGGRVAIVDFEPDASPVCAHAVAEERVRREMEEAGYRLVAQHDFLERQIFLVFAPAPAG